MSNSKIVKLIKTLANEKYFDEDLAFEIENGEKPLTQSESPIIMHVVIGISKTGPNTTVSYLGSYTDRSKALALHDDFVKTRGHACVFGVKLDSDVGRNFHYTPEQMEALSGNY